MDEVKKMNEKDMKKKFYQNRFVRAIALIVCVISFNLAAILFMGMTVFEYSDLYQRSKEQAMKNLEEKECRNYSVIALDAYRNGTKDCEALKDTRFRYGIIKTDQIDNIDVTDVKQYEYCNFDRKINREDLVVYSCNLGKNSFVYKAQNAFDSSYIDNQWDYQTKAQYIRQCLYARDSNEFYFVTELGKIYPQLDYDMTLYDDEEALVGKEGIAGYIEAEKVDGQTEFHWKSGDYRIVSDFGQYFTEEIEIITLSDLEEYGEVIRTEDLSYQFEDGKILSEELSSEGTTPYFVLSYAAEPNEQELAYISGSIGNILKHWEQYDYFTQLEAVTQLMYQVHQYGYGWLFLLILFGIAGFVLYTAGIGHTEMTQDGSIIKETLIQKIPLEVLWFVVGCLLYLGICCLYMMTQMRLVAASYFVVAMVVALMECLLILTYSDFVLRIKTKNVLNSFLIVRAWRRFKNCLLEMVRGIPLMGKVAVVLAGISFLEFFGLLALCGGDDGIMVVWFLEKIVICPVILVWWIHFKRLKEEARSMAKGTGIHPIRQPKYFTELQDFQEQLLHIQDGIDSAVSQKMKSERFKTELITNVSHDIKTPLTSIINYVDLLSKEELENETVKEYLEVLQRQSARLKKLIEDLMEASKASTGNLTIHPEKLDAKVLLTQIVGEFEEKLCANDIELIVQGDSVDIVADPRYLWRVFDNVMNNICKYALESTRAYVNVEKKEQYGVITFRNISKYPLNISSEELMERFVRGDSSRNTEGSGLGISIAKSLTELMKGKFELLVDGDLFKVEVYIPLDL